MLFIIPSLLFYLATSAIETFFSGHEVLSLIVIFLGMIILIATSLIGSFMWLKTINAKKEKFNFSKLFQAGIVFLPIMILYAIVITLLIGLGLILIIIPGIILSIYLVFSFNALVVDNLSIKNSFFRSYEVVKDNWWKVFAFFLLIGIINVIINMIFGIPFGLIVGALTLIGASSVWVFLVQAVSSLVSSIISALITLFITAFSLRFYEALKKEKKIK